MVFLKDKQSNESRVASRLFLSWSVMEKTKAVKRNRQSAGKAELFFERNFPYFFAPIITLVLYLVALIAYGVIPFGDKYTVASYDLSAQICPFVEHLFDVLDGKSSLFYSYAIAGGADVFGTFAYFFISPFSFLFLLFGDGMVNRAAFLVMLFKLMSVAFAGTWFAKKLFQEIPDYLCVAVGVVYAYCGYTFVANTYINWMDFLIYLPFTAGAFVRFVRTEKLFRFSVLIAFCIYTCFSIACFSMFTVFPALIAYGLFCVKKEKRNRFIAYICLAFLTAILLALPILLPALAAYLGSGRGGSLFENFWYGYTLVDGAPTSLQSSQFVESFATALYRKWSYIFSDSVFFVLTVIWFVRSKLKTPFSKFMLIAGILTLLPTIVDESMLLLNMGSYMSYALRFGFLNALYFLGGACLCMQGICYRKKHAYDGEKLRLEKENEGGVSATNEETAEEIAPSVTQKNYRIWGAAFACAGLLAVIFTIFFIVNKNYIYLWNGVLSDELFDMLKGFSSRFAHSLGGMEGYWPIAVLVAIFTSVGATLVAKRKISPFLLSIVLCAVVGLQVVFFNDQLVLGNLSTQHQPLDSYSRLVRLLDEREDGEYYRVKDYGDTLTANAPFSGGANSVSVFSSVIDADNFIVCNLFGYSGNGKNSLKSAHNQDKSNRCDEFGDSFLGYKYYFVKKDKLAHFAKGSKLSKYVKPVYVTDEKGKRAQMQDGEYYIFENEIVFPSAYVLPRGDYEFSKPNEANASYRRYNQEALYEFLRGKTLIEMKEITGSDSITYVTPETARELSEYLWQRAADVEVDAGKITARVKNARAGECLFLNFVASKGYTVTVNGKPADLVENDLKFLSVRLEEGENTVEFTYQSPYGKYIAVGALASVVTLCAVALVVTKTKFMQFSAPVIAAAGVLLAAAVVAFFMIFPACACAVKLVRLCIP